ncbi:MAG: flagellar FlbD family protein [Anaerolineales bacterium]|nr:flagellar FlbD family protein [Anaerolineales bacterium]
MIAVTRLNGSRLYVNAEQIEFIESTPDTVLTLLNGTKLLIKEKPDEVVEAVLAFKRSAYGAPPQVIRRGG